MCTLEWKSLKISDDCISNYILLASTRVIILLMPLNTQTHRAREPQEHDAHVFPIREERDEKDEDLSTDQQQRLACT